MIYPQDTAGLAHDLNEKADELPLNFASFYYSLKVTKGKDEREDVQKKTFAKWINSQLTKINHAPIEDLFLDLRDGIVLLNLLELLIGKEIKRETGCLKVHHLANLNIVLSVLKDQKIRIINISANDIFEGNPKLTLGLVWNIIQHWQVRDIFKATITDIYGTNLENTLLNWCQHSSRGYENVNIIDFTSSWKDGLAFNAIIHKYRPNLFCYNDLLKQSSTYNLEHAFNIAQKFLNIDRLLDIEDVLTDFPDKKSIMMYIMCFYQVLAKSAYKEDETKKNLELLVINSSKNDKNNLTASISLLNSEAETNDQKEISSRKNSFLKMASISTSSSSSTNNSAQTLEGYLLDLKKVIEWLLTSENLLNNQTEISNDVNVVKQQFQIHEDFMLELTKYQSNVGLVLQEGTRLLNSGVVSQEDEVEVKKQMKILNDMWENLRLLSVERQSKLHESLMKLQMDQLNQMDNWLKIAENRIQNINQLADSLEELIEQKEELSRLQDDLVKEQEAVDCLKQIIVVVDDNTDDQAFNDLESKLSNLSDRWSNVCKFVGNRWFIIQDLILKLQNIESDFNNLNSWIVKKSVELSNYIKRTEPMVLKNKLNVNYDNKKIDVEHLEPYEDSFTNSLQLIKTLKEIELEMQTMHSKLNDMNEIGEQIGSQLSNCPQLSNSINNKMDILELKWNALLEKMEYLSKVCSEQQQYEIKNNIKPELEEVGDKKLTNVTDNLETFCSRLDVNFNNIKLLISSEELFNNEDTIKRAQNELVKSEELLKKLKTHSESLKTNKNQNEIENLVKSMEMRWIEIKELVEDSNNGFEKNNLIRKASEELSTLRDVFEGYHKYISSVEAVCTDDPQKLGLQLETNKTKLKGMNSYDTRLKELLSLAKKLDKCEISTEIEKIASKWNETYLKINNRNEEIQQLINQNKKPSKNTENLAMNSSMKKFSENTSSGVYHYTHKHIIDNFGENRSPSETSSISDEDVHVVTNVYTIPITKTSNVELSVSQKPVGLTEHENQFRTLTFENYAQKSFQSSSQETSENLALIKSNEPDNFKSKFQIRSIVEIYESQKNKSELDEKDFGFFKTSNIVNETISKEILKNDEKDELQQNLNTSLKTTSHDEEASLYSENKRKIIEMFERWEKSLRSNIIGPNFLSVLEDQVLIYKEIISEMIDSKSIFELFQNQKGFGEEHQTNLKNFKSKYLELNNLANQNCSRLETLVKELTQFQSGYARALSEIKRVEALLEVEHHSSSGSGLERTLEEQLSILKRLKNDFEALNLLINNLNEQAQHYLIHSNNLDFKFSSKLKTDMNEINESFSKLKNNYFSKQFKLEDVLNKSNKIDEQIDELEKWIRSKEAEILDDEGIILTEEQFDQRTIKYKQIKSEIEMREAQVRKILDYGNDLLKNSSGVNDLTKLANQMKNINSRWSNMNSNIDSKNRTYSQLGEYINELRQLLHQEHNWLETIKTKINAYKLGGDSQELNDELESIQKCLKVHSNSHKERINELSNLLIERNVLIQLVNNDVKELFYKVKLANEEANKVIQMIETTISDTQYWEKRLLDLQQWILYMDKYLSARLDNEIYADDVPIDFQRVQEEFSQNELILKELEDEVEKYRNQGKSESASRLDQNLEIMRNNWSSLEVKFKKFQKPADFDIKFNKVKKALDEIEQSLYLIELKSEDSETIHIQLENCLKLYKSLSELKPQIEYVLKQGRSIVDKKQVDNTEILTKQLDTLKLKYNELGSKVTNGKNELEKGFKLGKKFRKEFNLVNDFLSKLDGELKKIEQKPLSKNYTDELDWIKNTKYEVNKVQSQNLELMRSLLKSFEDLVSNKPSYKQMNNGQTKISDTEQKIVNILKRIDERENFLSQQIQKLDESFNTFVTRSKQINIQIERSQKELNDTENQDNFKEKLNLIQEQLNHLITEIEMVKALATELCSKSEKYNKAVENELQNILHGFDDLNRRYKFSYETSEQQAQDVTTVTKTETHQQSRHAKESRYYRSRKAKSPSVSSVDSSADIFDSELKQKYMRAVAYLRILDETPLMENEQDSRNQRAEDLSSVIDIDFIIKQAKHVAQINEANNPDRARRIMEKVEKLEQRWLATKNKRNSLNSSSRLQERYKEKSDNVKDQIHILEQFSIYKSRQEQDEEGPSNFLYGPSDFIYDASDFMDNNQINNQQSISYLRQNERYQDTFDTRSVISEPPLTKKVIVTEVPAVQQPVVIRKYKTTKTTTTTQHALPNQSTHMIAEHNIHNDNLQNYNTQQRYYRNQESNYRSSSIPPNHNQRYEFSSNQSQPVSGARYYTSNSYSARKSENTGSGLKRAASVPKQLREANQFSSSSSRNVIHKSNSEVKNATNYNMRNSDSMNYNNSYNKENKCQQYYQNHKNLESNSCIDYNKSYFNSDWSMRHANFHNNADTELRQRGSSPIQIPIYQENVRSNSSTAFGAKNI